MFVIIKAFVGVTTFIGVMIKAVIWWADHFANGRDKSLWKYRRVFLQRLLYPTFVTVDPAFATEHLTFVKTLGSIHLL